MEPSIFRVLGATTILLGIGITYDACPKLFSTNLRSPQITEYYVRPKAKSVDGECSLDERLLLLRKDLGCQIAHADQQKFIVTQERLEKYVR